MRYTESAALMEIEIHGNVRDSGRGERERWRERESKMER